MAFNGSDFSHSFLDAVPNGAIYIVLSLLVRCIMGVGSAGCGTTSLAILAKEFPDSIATVNVWDFPLFNVTYRLMVLGGLRNEINDVSALDVGAT